MHSLLEKHFFPLIGNYFLGPVTLWTRIYVSLVFITRLFLCRRRNSLTRKEYSLIPKCEIYLENFEQSKYNICFLSSHDEISNRATTLLLKDWKCQQC